MLTAVKTWFISGAVHLVVGFVAGWIILKRPEWVEAIIAKIKSKIGIGS